MTNVISAIVMSGGVAVMVALRDHLLVNLVATLFPRLFQYCFLSLITRVNNYIEVKKSKGKFQKSWVEFEIQLITAIEDTLVILKK